MEPGAQDYTKHPTDNPNEFILEYSNGRRILVEIDPVTGKQHFIREL
jgi:hypothetical protein